MKDLRDSENMFSITGHLTKEQMMLYHLGRMQQEEQYAVEKHLVDCELCKDALSGIALIPDYKGIDKIRKDIRRLARPHTDSMNKIAWRIVVITVAVLALLTFITLYVLYFLNKGK